MVDQIGPPKKLREAPDGPPAAEVGRSGEHLELGRLHGYLGFRLRRVHQRLSRRFAERTKALGMRSGGISALAIIEANPGVSQAEIAREIDVDASVAVGLLNDLRRRSLVVRTRLAGDRRRYAITLTDQGRDLLEEAFTLVAEAEDEVLRCLSPTELLFLGRIFDKIYMQLADPAQGPEN